MNSANRNLKKKSSFCEGKVYRGSISQNFEWITEVLGKFSDNKSSNETTFWNKTKSFTIDKIKESGSALSRFMLMGLITNEI